MKVSILKKRLFGGGLVLVFLIFLVTLLSVVYHYTDMQIYSHLQTQPKKYLREIDTLPKLWLNGHLGIFFRFRYFGNLLWLLVPLLGYFFLKKKPGRWQWALLLPVLLLLLAIGIKGYQNYRYQLTLFPFLVSILLLVAWEIFKGKRKIVKAAVFSLALLLCLYNIYHYIDRYRFFWNYKVTAIEDRFPHRTLQFLKEKAVEEPDEKVLVCLQPLFFYHLDRQAVNFLDPRVRSFLRPTGNRRHILDHLRNTLNIKFIFFDYRILARLNNRVFSEMINVDCRRIYHEKRYRLYQLRDNIFEQTVENHKEKGVMEIKVGHGHRDRTLPKPGSLRLRALRKRGKFQWSYSQNKGQKILSIHNTRPDKKGQRILQLGCSPDVKTLDLVTNREPRYLYLLVRARVSHDLINRNNEIFIQDYDGKWEKERRYFTSSRWRTYLVKKRLRKGIEKLQLGIKMIPGSREAQLKISEFKIYVSPMEL